MYSYRVLFVYFLTIICVSTEEDSSLPMSKEERISLREEARKMFYHAYDAYMDNAFPADELMPLSCKGRWRGVTPGRGDLDDVLGKDTEIFKGNLYELERSRRFEPFDASTALCYSLTLVDSLDTLIVLGDFHQFNRAIKLVIKNVHFDHDVVVSVFETNIRMLGGLLSAHILAMELRENVPCLRWYSQELLAMADDLGNRLLPAFNTSTGLPQGRVNLRRGMAGVPKNRETCTACAGTMILEFAALSRLTGKPIYEQKASRAMDRLWKIRHRTSELMGTTIDVHSGDWVRKDSGVGAGIDSYYEYCLKAYVLLGDKKYLTRFNRHYNAIKKYISRGPLMLAVYMHRPHLQSSNFMDALLAFWPGLQVMMGDLRPAVETHEMLYQVMQRHTFIPEAFTSDFQVHWGQHPLRPEFLESTYFLHRATGDDHYLRVGRSILKSLQQYARVPCGYAAVNDVRTRVHEDRMDSFVLAETLKYLFMLFSEDSDLPVNIERFIMTTEAHFLPLSLGQSISNSSVRIMVLDEDEEDKTRRTCPNTSSMVPRKVREPMRQLVGAAAAQPIPRLRPITDPRQLHALSEMGISVMSLEDGRIQLLYTTSTLAQERFGELLARSANDAAAGLSFMNEMTKWNNQGDTDNGVQVLGIIFANKVYTAGPAHFGQEISGDNVFEGTLALVNPPDACSEITNKMEVAGKFGIAFRGSCTFTQKVWHMQVAGVKAAIIIDNTPNSTADTSNIFAMSNDGKEDVDVVIPSAFLYSKEGVALIDALKEDPDLVVTLAERARLQKMLTCPGDECQDGQVDTERSSIDHLKTVLSQLVAQFELSMNADEAPKRTHIKSTYPQIVYSKDKFVNKDNRGNYGETSNPSTSYVKEKIVIEEVEDEDPTSTATSEDNSSNYIQLIDETYFETNVEEYNNVVGRNFDNDKDNQYGKPTVYPKDKIEIEDQNVQDEVAATSSEDNTSNYIQLIDESYFEPKEVAEIDEYNNDKIFGETSSDEEVDEKAKKIKRGVDLNEFRRQLEMLNLDEYKNDRFRMELSKIDGIVEFTIEPEDSENSKSRRRHAGLSKTSLRLMGLERLGRTPYFPFVSRNAICPIIDFNTRKVYVKVGTKIILLPEIRANALKAESFGERLSDAFDWEKTFQMEAEKDKMEDIATNDIKENESKQAPDDTANNE